METYVQRKVTLVPEIWSVREKIVQERVCNAWTPVRFYFIGLLHFL